MRLRQGGPDLVVVRCQRGPGGDGPIEAPGIEGPQPLLARIGRRGGRVPAARDADPDVLRLRHALPHCSQQEGAHDHVPRIMATRSIACQTARLLAGAIQRRARAGSTVLLGSAVMCPGRLVRPGQDPGTPAQECLEITPDELTGQDRPYSLPADGYDPPHRNDELLLSRVLAWTNQGHYRTGTTFPYTPRLWLGQSLNVPPALPAR